MNARLLVWLSILGATLTLVGRANEFRQVVSWLATLTGYWNYLMAGIWSVVGSFLNVHIPHILGVFLSFMIFVIGITANSLRSDEGFSWYLHEKEMREQAGIIDDWTRKGLFFSEIPEIVVLSIAGFVVLMLIFPSFKVAFSYLFVIGYFFALSWLLKTSGRIVYGYQTIFLFGYVFLIFLLFSSKLILDTNSLIEKIFATSLPVIASAPFLFAYYRTVMNKISFIMLSFVTLYTISEISKLLGVI
ncbi:MAG TPA: hypothetical protein VH858_00860 [Hyphomicrobiales bacterium]